MTTQYDAIVIGTSQSAPSLARQPRRSTAIAMRGPMPNGSRSEIGRSMWGDPNNQQE